MSFLRKRHQSLLTKVHSEENKPGIEAEELPDEWWYRVYWAVIATTVLVLALLWAFSRYFSS